MNSRLRYLCQPERPQPSRYGTVRDSFSKAPMLIFDAHLDLAMNAMEGNRDLTRPLKEIRARERGHQSNLFHGSGTVCFEEMRRGRIGLCAATLLGRCIRHGSRLRGWFSQEQAWAHTQGQMAWYRAMIDAGELAAICTRTALQRHLVLWLGKENAEELPQPTFSRGPTAPPARMVAARSGHLGQHRPATMDKTLVSSINEAARERMPIGFVLTLEGADSLISLSHMEQAYAAGLRVIGPAHYGPGIYASGTDARGGLTARGRELLKEMERMSMILDVSHLHGGFWEALDRFSGPVWASHSNCRALVPHHRQLNNAQIRALIERNAVIGVALDGWMMVPGWVPGQTTSATAKLKMEKIVDHIEHIAELAGNCRHVGIGSDLDGGFGTERTPLDLRTIAGLAQLASILQRRGFPDEQIRAILYGNFTRFLMQFLPA